MTPIAHIRSAFPTKFGIPRQAGIVDTLESVIVFTPPFRNPDALRGIDEFDYIWLIWQFSQNLREGDTTTDGVPQWSPTVRPPRLGGNKRMGVFATRSSFRPNALALSSVRLLSVEWQSPDGPLLHVAGADLMDGTPIFDIKPYLPYTDAHPDARSGFAPTPADHLLQVHIPDPLMARVPQQHRDSLVAILAHDPRPSYHHDPGRIYGLNFYNLEVKFKIVDDNNLEVVNIF